MGKHDFSLDLTGCSSVMAGRNDLKFSGGILGSTGLLARMLLEMCMIPFKAAGVDIGQNMNSFAGKSVHQDVGTCCSDNELDRICDSELICMKMSSSLVIPGFDKSKYSIEFE